MFSGVITFRLSAQGALPPIRIEVSIAPSSAAQRSIAREAIHLYVLAPKPCYNPDPGSVWSGPNARRCQGRLETG